MSPQPSPAGPHWMPCSAQFSGVQEPVGGEPHWPLTPPPPHVWPAGHGWQSEVNPPQPSLCCPHVPVAYDALVRDVHVPPSGAPHMPGVPPPPQLCGAAQVPQLLVSPLQPSVCCPHVPGG